MPVLYIGTDGKLYGQFWTGTVAPIVSSGKVNGSALHSVTLVGQGNTQSMYSTDFVLLHVAKFLMGPANVTALGGGVTVHAAELGVCWTFWMIAWANIFENRPTRFTTGVNVLLRIAITGALACGTYLLYYFVLAPHVLHEPASAGTLHGDALGFIDWAILWNTLVRGVPRLLRPGQTHRG
ncbi:hypothetical protein AB0F91_42295 [Amycolatopsis sp. NPDC023774]|uniref:hypothetical protein n=1 Tax=Amycolatopsis sp. NPDC023774 TaxID=3155015 RepID=UPI00340F571C